MNGDKRALAGWTTLIVLTVWVMNVAYRADDKADKAIRIAENSRPYPYTIHDARDYQRRHQAQHDREIGNTREWWKAELRAFKADLEKQIQGLPRPPPIVAERLDSFDTRLTKLESVVRYGR